MNSVKMPNLLFDVEPAERRTTIHAYSMYCGGIFCLIGELKEPSSGKFLYCWVSLSRSNYSGVAVVIFA